MLEFFSKLFRSALFIGMAALIGWYDFGVAGYMGVATNLFFAAVGGLLVHTWISPTRKESAVSLEAQSSVEHDIDANAAGTLGGTAKVETITQTTTPQDTDAAETNSPS